MFDLTYLRGMLKKVATGGGEAGRSGGSTRLVNILDGLVVADLVKFFE